MEYLVQNYRKWRNLRKWDHHRGVSRPPLWAHQPFQALMIYVKGSKVILHPRIKVVFALKGERSTHMYNVLMGPHVTKPMCQVDLDDTYPL